MNESNWFDIAIGAVVAVMGWLLKRFVNRVDTLEKNSVTHEELKEFMQQQREDRARMHEEARADLHYIRERVDSMADRR